MKSRKNSFWLCFGILLLTVTSCGRSQTPTVFTSQTTPADTVGAPTLNSTQTISSQTPTPLVNPSATIATVAVVPTLDIDQANSFLQRLVEGSPDCQLPCWAGINPGITTNIESATLVQSLSILTYGGPYFPYQDKEFSGASGGRDFFFGDTKIRFGFGWYSERGIDTVEMLRINADAIVENSAWVYGSEPYNTLFEKYNLHNILSEHGIPSEVWTIAEVYDYGGDVIHPNQEEFTLLLFYDKGIFIKYLMPLKRMGDSLGAACPSEAFFDMGLVAPEASNFYQGMWFSTVTGSQDFSSYMPIEKATQMTLNEFNQAFMVSNSPCFETPLSIWPKH